MTQSTEAAGVATPDRGDAVIEAKDKAPKDEGKAPA